MTKRVKAMGALLLLAALTGLVPATENPVAQRPAGDIADLAVPLPDAVRKAVAESADITESLEFDFTVSGEAQQERLERAIVEAGGQVTLEEKTFVRAKLPPAAAKDLPVISQGIPVGTNGTLTIEPGQLPPVEAPLSESVARQNTIANFGPMGLDDFRAEQGSTGNGIVVAVIDTGVDPGHPALRQTPKGQPKIVDWKDFTSEGLVPTGQPITKGESFRAPDGRQFTLPDAVLAMDGQVRFGYWDESSIVGYINRDLDRNGQKIDRFGVLVVDSNADDRYETVYVDTNHDLDFGDETALALYSESQGYGRLGEVRVGERGARRLNFVVADIDPAGGWVRLGFDGEGHGTQVAGVLSAYAPGGYTGVAPGVQIMALKALRSTGTGTWFDIKRAIQYAASHGASIINLSIGGLGAAAIKEFDSGASEWLNQVAAQYHVLVVIAADNSGPGLSSGTTLGNPSAIMAVGSYYSPEMWMRDYKWVVPHETIWFFSGMGPRSDGTYLPNVVAPGGSTSTSPLWRDPTGYMTAIGTSIATPHVSGAAALLMEAGRAAGVQSDWISVKRALEMGARKVPGFEVFEQGNGLIQLRSAFKHLQQINPVPTLNGQLYNGQGGLLARSYTPRSSAFVLTNLDRQLVRVGIFSSDSWVQPAYKSMTLPPGVRRELPLQLNPPGEPGVHAAFLQVTNPSKYGPGLLLPVTHVQPIDLAAEKGAYSVSQSLEAGRYRRYFFDVKPGTGQLTVSARVPLTLGRGTVQVYVFRPDGNPVHEAKIGVNGDGLATLSQVTDPVEGVWEVVVVALPDVSEATANPGYTLDVKASPGALATVPYRISVPAGSTTEQSITLTNSFEAFTGAAEAVGLVKADAQNPWNANVPWRVEHSWSSVIETFTLQEFTSDLQVEIDTPVPASADLGLYLYRVDSVRGLELRAQSDTPGTSHEVLSGKYLPAGTYKVLLLGGLSDPVQFQYRRLMAVEGYNLTLADTVRKHIPGETWTVPLTIKAPQSPGRYSGQILLRDTERGRILGWYPLEVSVGKPALSIQPMVSQLVSGQQSTVVLEVRDAVSGQLISNPELVVNGQRYRGRAGRVSVTLVPTGVRQSLEVEADLPAYQFTQEHFDLPVRETWGDYPVGLDSSFGNDAWRRKVSNQLP